MNVKRVALSVVYLSCLAVPSSAAEEPANAGDGAVRGTYMGEAAGAVVGRVFGVEGDASDIQYHVFELTQHSPGSAAVRSLAIPGWGQHFNNQKAKGKVFFLTAAGALAASIKLYDRAQSSYDDYKATGVQNGTLYDDYKKERTQAIVMGSATAILWAVAVIDAYRNAYQPLYTKAHSIDVAFQGDEAQVVYKKNF